MRTYAILSMCVVQGYSFLILLFFFENDDLFVMQKCFKKLSTFCICLIFKKLLGMRI